MGKTRTLYLALVVYLGFGYSGFGQLLTKNQICVLTQADKLVGIKESSGSNRGPELDRIVRAAGGRLGDMWCGHSQKYIFEIACGIKVAAGGVAASWFPPRKKVDRKDAAPGDHAGISYNNRGVQHVTMVKSIGPGRNFVVTLEGNYGNAFKVVTRPMNKIYSFARWWK